MAWQEPKTDWVANPKSPMSEDFNRIESNIDFLKGDIETKKGAIVDALNTVGLASELTDTHATLASRITGSNQGTKIITPSTVNQTIAKGFHSGQGYVKGDANLVATNIKKGASIFGIIGSVIEGKRAAKGTAYSDPNANTVTVTGLSFTPTAVLVYGGSQNNYLGVLLNALTFRNGYAYGYLMKYNGDPNTALTTNPMLSGGFSFNLFFEMQGIVQTFKWIAIEI